MSGARSAMTAMTATTVLFVDDDPVLRKTVAMSLTKVAGYVVTTADSGALALAIAQSSPPDVILLDAQMPEMDGRATFEALRASPRTAAIPVIFLTASSQQEEVFAFLRMGAKGVIGKPFKPLELAAEITRLLEAPLDPISAPPAAPGGRSHSMAPSLVDAVEASLAEMRASYGATLAPKLRALDDAIAAALSGGGADALALAERLAHRLHGTAGSFGFDDVSAAAGAIESAIRDARRNHHAVPDVRLDELRRGLARAADTVPSNERPEGGPP